jgi:hypothetical protein
LLILSDNDALNLKIIIALIVGLLLLPLLLYGFVVSFENEFDEFYFGVDVAYADVNKIKDLLDKVSDFTNFFVIGSTGVSHNQVRLNQTISYLESHGLDYSVYTGNAGRLALINESVIPSQESFLGIYYDDEFGGKQLDLDDHSMVRFAENYSDAANQFIDWVRFRINAEFYINDFNLVNDSVSFLVPSDFRLFTSDYALYWFDYKAGIDVVLSQFGWNYSRQINIAQVRGAATVMDRDWGVIVAWTFREPPYLGSGEELFNDLVLAYENGAKYVVVFDSNEGYTDSILNQEHLDAMERFWQYTKDNPRPSNLLDGRVAFVLPKDWAYGFRGPDDKIWGLWETDELVSTISEDLGALLDEYGSKLDVIYDDGLELDSTYKEYIFWNGTTITP